MKVTYNNVVIAADAADSGTDTAVNGFDVDKWKAQIQTEMPIRSPYAVRIARGNREGTLTGTIIPVPAPTLAAALLAKAAFYATLPDQADLVVSINGETVTYPQACLSEIALLKDYKGVGYGFTLSFEVGEPAQAAPGAVLGTGVAGQILGDGAGNELGTGT